MISAHSASVGTLAGVCGGGGGAGKVSVNVHDTLSPAARTIVAVAVPRLTVESPLGSTHDSAVKFQPAGTDCTTVYEPGATPLNAALPLPPAVVIGNAALPGMVLVKLKVPLPPTATSLMVIELAWVSTNVHTTPSPGPTLIVAVAVPMLTDVLPLGDAHDSPVSVQPAGTVSVIVYAPGTRLLIVLLPALATVVIENGAMPLPVPVKLNWALPPLVFLTVVIDPRLVSV